MGSNSQHVLPEGPKGKRLCVRDGVGRGVTGSKDLPPGGRSQGLASWVWTTNSGTSSGTSGPRNG